MPNISARPPRSIPSTSFAALAPHGSATRSQNSLDRFGFSPKVWRTPGVETPHQNFALPRSIPSIPTQMSEMLVFAISRCKHNSTSTSRLFLQKQNLLGTDEQLVGTSFFPPAYDQVMRSRESLSWRLQVSPAARWSMFIAAKVFQSMVEPPQVRAAKFTKYHDWIKRFEEKMDAVPLHSFTSAEVQNRLGERLEIMLFKLRTLNSINTYQLLRDQAPTFLQIVFSDPTLWPSTYDSIKVSLAHILASTRYEITHFALLDMMCSMAYGLPQVIDYDTSVPPLKANVNPVEWIHGCPVELQTVIVKINSLCNWNQIGPAPDWQCLEQELHDWRPPTCKVSEEESWRVVAQLAVRESWRHTLLIYLYM
ncbi:hypothetical protein FRC10_005567, partial [Ceratobasidium sp. 414]